MSGKEWWTKHKKKMIVIACAILVICLVPPLLLCLAMGVNGYVWLSTQDSVAELDGFAEEDTYDCILVLGAGVRGDAPSDMLRDRLETACALYHAGVAPKIVMSGDHGSVGYDEVNVMKEYAILCGVPSEDIFMDHAGFSTYESVYRIKEIFGAERIVVVTQTYHLFRALYISESFGLEAVGVSADVRTYRGALWREAREVAARCKDAVYCIFKPLPTYLGESISLEGSGDITNDN